MFISILKIIALSTQANSSYIWANKSKNNIENDNNISSNKIDNRIVNLSNKTKVYKSFGIDFFIFKASLAFIKLKERL